MRPTRSSEAEFLFLFMVSDSIIWISKMGNSNSYISQRSRYNADTMSSQFSSFKMSDDSSWGYTRDQGTSIHAHTHTHTHTHTHMQPHHHHHHPYKSPSCIFPGPDTWWVYHPNASGTHQSPIDIDPSIADFDSDLAAFPLKVSYRDTSNKVCKWSICY